MAEPAPPAAHPNGCSLLERVEPYCNHVQRHAGVGLHTPASVHYGTAGEIRERRAATLDAAYAANPARFRHRPPTPPKVPTVA